MSGPCEVSGAPQAAGGAPWAGRSPGPAGTCWLVRRERLWRSLVLPPATFLQRARVVPREEHGKRGRCLLSFPCFNKHILICGCFVSFSLPINYWEVIYDCDSVGSLALPEACTDGVLTFAPYVRENSSCLYVLFAARLHSSAAGLVADTNH